jgi:hypothetical protein
MRVIFSCSPAAMASSISGAVPKAQSLELRTRSFAKILAGRRHQEK